MTRSLSGPGASVNATGESLSSLLLPPPALSVSSSVPAPGSAQLATSEIDRLLTSLSAGTPLTASERQGLMAALGQNRFTAAQLGQLVSALEADRLPPAQRNEMVQALVGITAQLSAGRIQAYRPLLQALNNNELSLVLGSDSYALRAVSTQLLQSRGMAARPALLQILATSNDPEMITRVDGILGNIERVHAGQLLQQVFFGTPAQRAQALQTLTSHRQDAAAGGGQPLALSAQHIVSEYNRLAPEVLMQALVSPNANVSGYANEALRQLGGPLRSTQLAYLYFALHENRATVHPQFQQFANSCVTEIVATLRGHVVNNDQAGIAGALDELYTIAGLYGGERLHSIMQSLPANDAVASLLAGVQNQINTRPPSIRPPMMPLPAGNRS